MAIGDDPNIGLKLGNYVLLEKLGAGGMACVYLAEHPEIGRKVAVKILNQSMLERTSLCERFLTEAKTLARLRHPRIIEIYDYGRLESGQPYYAMEYLEGQEFGDRMKAAGQLPMNDLVPIFDQLCQGLQAAHDAGVIHRDLKPPNIFIQEGKELSVKLLDFGIAKILDQSIDDSELTQTGMVLGSPVTIAPEQVQGEKNRIGPATDIYALGVILHWAIAGRPPFYGARAPMIMAMHVQEPAPRLDSVVDGLPESLVDVVARCLLKDPQDRFQTPDELFKALEKATHDLSAQDTIFPRTKSEISAASNSEHPTAPAPAPAANSKMSSAATEHATGHATGKLDSGEELSLKAITTTLGSAIGEISSITGPERRKPRWITPLAFAGVAAIIGLFFFLTGTRQKTPPQVPTRVAASSNPDIVSTTAKPKTEESQSVNGLLNVEVRPVPAEARCQVSLDGQVLQEQKSPCKYRFRKGAAIAFSLHAEGYASKTIKWRADSARTFAPELDKLPAPQETTTEAASTTASKTAVSNSPPTASRSKKSRAAKRVRKKKRPAETDATRGKPPEPAKAPKYKIRDGTMGF